MRVLELVKMKKDKNYIKTKVTSDHPAKAYLKVLDRLRSVTIGYDQDPETEASLLLLDTTRICIPRGVDDAGVSDGHLRRKPVKLLHVPHMGEIKAGRVADRRYY